MTFTDSARFHLGPRCDHFLHVFSTYPWIDDGDFASKRIFSFLLIFFSLAETGVTPQTPVLTVPAN